MNPFRTIATSSKEFKHTRSLVLSAIFAALYAIFMTPFFGNIIIIPGQLEIRLGYLIIALSSMILGPVPGILIAFVGDIVGTLLFYGGEFFFGYTLNWMIQALIFGIFFYKNKISIVRATLSMLVNTIVVNLFFSTMWQSYLYGSTFQATLLTKLPLNVITFIPKTVLLYLLLKTVITLIEKTNVKI